MVKKCKFINERCFYHLFNGKYETRSTYSETLSFLNNLKTWARILFSIGDNTYTCIINLHIYCHIDCLSGFPLNVQR